MEEVEGLLALERARCSDLEKGKAVLQCKYAKSESDCNQWRTRADELYAESENAKEVAARAVEDLAEERKVSENAKEMAAQAVEELEERKISVDLRARLSTTVQEKTEALEAVGRLKEENAQAFRSRNAMSQRLLEAESKARNTVRDYFQSVACAKTIKETVLRILRPFTVKLAAKFPSRSASITEACKLFMEQYFSDFWYPDLPDPADDKVLSDTEDFDEFCPPEEEPPVRTPSTNIPDAAT